MQWAADACAHALEVVQHAGRRCCQAPPAAARHALQQRTLRCPPKRSRAGAQSSHMTRPHSLKRVKSKMDGCGDAGRQQRAGVPAVMPACKQGEAFAAASRSARAATFVGFPCGVAGLKQLAKHSGEEMPQLGAVRCTHVLAALRGLQ